MLYVQALGNEKYTLPQACPKTFANISRFDLLPDTKKRKYNWYPVVVKPTPKNHQFTGRYTYRLLPTYAIEATPVCTPIDVEAIEIERLKQFEVPIKRAMGVFAQINATRFPKDFDDAAQMLLEFYSVDPSTAIVMSDLLIAAKIELFELGGKWGDIAKYLKYHQEGKL